MRPITLFIFLASILLFSICAVASPSFEAGDGSQVPRNRRVRFKVNRLCGSGSCIKSCNLLKRPRTSSEEFVLQNTYAVSVRKRQYDLSPEEIERQREFYLRKLTGDTHFSSKPDVGPSPRPAAESSTKDDLFSDYHSLVLDEEDEEIPICLQVFQTKRKTKSVIEIYSQKNLTEETAGHSSPILGVHIKKYPASLFYNRSASYLYPTSRRALRESSSHAVDPSGTAVLMLEEASLIPLVFQPFEPEDMLSALWSIIVSIAKSDRHANGRMALGVTHNSYDFVKEHMRTSECSARNFPTKFLCFDGNRYRSGKYLYTVENPKSAYLEDESS